MAESIEREAANRRCPLCLGQEVLTRDRDNGISVEIDAEFKEIWIWQGILACLYFLLTTAPTAGHA